MKAGARLKCTQRSVWGASPESPLLVTLLLDSQTTYLVVDFGVIVLLLFLLFIVARRTGAT